MNRRLSGPIRQLKCLVVLIILCPAHISSAAPTTASIDASIRTSIDADKSVKAIEDFVTDQVEKLASDDPEARKSAREALVSNSTAPNATASLQYLSRYAEVLDTHLQPLATHQNVVVRLNVAIVAERVAANANNDRLRNVVLILLNDKNEAAIIWALKASRYVIPAVLSNPLIAKNDKLLPSVVSIVQAHPSSSVILQEGYTALMLNYLDPNRAKPPPMIWKPMVASASGEVVKLLQWRLDMYRNGVPPDPLAEREPASFLVHPDIAGVQSKDQRHVSAQMICDLMSLAALRVTTAAEAEKEPLINLVKRAANSILALAIVVDKDKANNLQQLNLPIQQANKASPNLQAMVAAVCHALQKDIPALGVMPTTLPSTQPAH